MSKQQNISNQDRLYKYLLSINKYQIPSLRKIWDKLGLHHQTVSNGIKYLKSQWKIYIDCRGVIFCNEEMQASIKVEWLYLVKEKYWLVPVFTDKDWKIYKLHAWHTSWECGIDCR